MTKPSHSGNAEWYENVASAQGGYVKGWSSEVEGFFFRPGTSRTS